MSIPGDFYYVLSQTKPDYTYTPTDLLDINKLIQSKAPWILPTSLIQKPKKLILNDWTAENWSHDKIKAVQQALFQLLKKGFILYIQQHEQIIPLLADDVAKLDRSEIRSAIRLAHPKDISIKATTQHRLTKDETFILDDYWIDRLIGRKEHNAPRSLNQSDYMGLNQRETVLLKEFLEQLNPPLELLILDEFSDDSVKNAEEFKQAFPSINAIQRLQKIIAPQKGFSKERWQKLLSSAPFLHDLKFAVIDETFKPAESSLTNLLRLELSSMEPLADFMIAAPNLKELSINIVWKDSKQNTQALQLEFLKLNSSSLDLNQLLQLLNEQAQSIQFFSLTNSNVNDDDHIDVSILLEIPQYLHLKEIDLTESYLTLPSLNIILSKTPNLKRLTFGGEVFLEMESSIELDEINEDVLGQLEYLCLSFMTWDDNKFNLLSNKLTNIKCLHLMDFEFKTLPDHNVFRMEKLEELCLTNCYFEHEEDLKKLLQFFPNIKRLRFINGSGVKDSDLIFDVSICKKLEVIDLSDQDGMINDQSLIDLINSSTHLKSLNLINCCNIAKHFKKDLSREFPQIHVYWRWDDIETTDVEDDPLCSDDEQDWEHNPDDYNDFKPTPDDFKFQFKGKSKSINQAMIIEKLSQYFSLNKTNVQYIPKIQDGICYALSQLFKRSTIDEWNDFIFRVKTWNGTLNTLNEGLKNDFKMLWNCIKSYQFSTIRNFQFIGDNLEQFLFINSKQDSVQDAYLRINEEEIDDWISFLLTPGSSVDPSQTSTSSNTIINPRRVKLQQGCILSSSWHAICIRLIDDDLWQVYNPNCKDGVKSVSTTELIHYIHTALGRLVSIEMEDESIVPEIHNPDMFIQLGGLFNLIEDVNSDKLTGIIPLDYQFSARALKGVLLQNTEGVPAWFCGISCPHTLQFTYNLLDQLSSLYPTDFSSMLINSIKRLTPEQKLKCIGVLIKSGPKNNSSSIELFSCPIESQPSELTTVLIEILKNTSDIKYFEQELKTWHKSSALFDTLEAYCQHVMEHDVAKNHLIELDSIESVQALRLALQRQCYTSNRPVYYIHSPDDLICSASFIERDLNNQGILRKGPGGPLHDFLTADHGLQSPILLVNYEQFSAEDIARFNALLDENRFADGTPVPGNVQIIGLYNTSKPDCYQGDDFYSRFNKKEQCPLSAKKLKKSVPPLPLVTEEKAEGVVINLYNASDWKERLLGRWELDGSILKFQEGALSGLQGKTITVQNGPWDDEDFNLFWTEACYPGTQYFPGSSIPVPADIQLNKKTGYALNDLKEWLQVQYLSDDCMSAEDLPHVLNPHCIANYFHNYRYEESDHSLQKEPGLIEKAQNNSLDVTLTRSISLDDWARILTECQKYQVKLRVKPAPEASFPAQFGLDLLPCHMEQTNWHPPVLARTEVIKSTDIDATITLLSAVQQDRHVIDVSELFASDLLLRVDGKLNEELLQFEFHQRSSWLLAALAEGKNIILKGHCSKEMEDQLSSLLMQRINTGVEPGTLLLITEDSDSFQCLSTKVHEVSEQDKRTCLGELPYDLEQFIAAESLSKLKARTTYLQAFPECHKSEAAWSGMSHHSAVIKPLVAFNPVTAKQEAEEFTHARLTLVRRMLDVAPYVFLSGMSGVGKTTLVTKELVQDGEQLHQGIEEIKAWAMDTRSGRKYLFLDEATLSSGNWSVFEGLFNNPPSIFYDGHYYPLSAEHKVIFAGNPVSYGDERHLATFFERHGNAVELEPLPTGVLYEKILKPALENQGLNDDEVPQLSSIFLDVYRFMVACSTTDVLITPRELEMMALLTNSYCRNNPLADRLDVAAHYAFKIALNLVPNSKKDLFIKEFQPKNPLLITASDESKEFFLTKSRLSSQQLLEDVLDLREWRQQFAVNDVQRYGGLGGLTFEGDPGIGKSEQIMQTLLVRGFKPMSRNSVPQPGDKPMYLIPVSMSYTDKEALLLKAFHEGAVVVIDEINSSPMMEKLLNSLLMGKTLQGGTPKKPGFLVIGTQNPISLCGRRAPSNALSRRMITEQLPLYPQNEMRSILMQKGVDKYIAQDMIKAFLKNKQKAENKRLSPGPTFRDLLRLADGYTNKHNKAQKRERLDNYCEEAEKDLKFARNLRSRKYSSTGIPNNTSSSSSSFFYSSKPLERKYGHSGLQIQRSRGF
ncbi:hypothetical protein [Legionella quateirensis]|uniref:AAA domain (Dynein-related subfamily) n=1 Tax=Legionella quateirensis TaxID=45072 RepID=A0A378L4U5_9GAMM|nr:hypothetical protein [Legionella quateirensis]KTD52732.1 hypothetical protein Lqua_0565 [Legionella quateirensis]STY19150.1 Uncharacterised protein [Legionella quateirensis]